MNPGPRKIPPLFPRMTPLNTVTLPFPREHSTLGFRSNHLKYPTNHNTPDASALPLITPLSNPALCVYLRSGKAECRRLSPYGLDTKAITPSRSGACDYIPYLIYLIQGVSTYQTGVSFHEDPIAPFLATRAPVSATEPLLSSQTTLSPRHCPVVPVPRNGRPSPSIAAVRLLLPLTPVFSGATTSRTSHRRRAGLGGKIGVASKRQARDKSLGISGQERWVRSGDRWVMGGSRGIGLGAGEVGEGGRREGWVDIGRVPRWRKASCVSFGTWEVTAAGRGSSAITPTLLRREGRGGVRAEEKPRELCKRQILFSLD